MDLAEVDVGPMIDAIYFRLMDRDFALEDPEVVMLLVALINILGHYNQEVPGPINQVRCLCQPINWSEKWSEKNASGDEQRGCLVWFTTESSCTTKEGESRRRSSDERDNARSQRNDARTGEDPKRARSSD